MAFARRTAAPAVGRTSVVVRASATALPAKFTAVQPSSDRVLVKLAKSAATTASGILLPSAAQTKKSEGQVVSVGHVDSLKAGDNVLYAKYAGTEIRIGEDDHVIMKEADVIGIQGDSLPNMKPLQDRILIKLVEDESQSRGGVLLTAQSSDKPTIGTVIAVGPGAPAPEGEAVKPVNIEVGAQVLYSKYSGIELEENDEKFIVVREMDIMAVLS